jgi:hypothetical protein
MNNIRQPSINWTPDHGVSGVSHRQTSTQNAKSRGILHEEQVFPGPELPVYAIIVTQAHITCLTDVEPRGQQQT